jgi:hypothetical protein
MNFDVKGLSFLHFVYIISLEDFISSKICRVDGKNRLHQRYMYILVQTNNIQKFGMNIFTFIFKRLSSIVSSISLPPSK